MPTESILPLALSGAEIKKAILDKIATALQKNCHLNDSLAYGDGFSFKVQIEVKAKDLGREVSETANVEGAFKTEMHGENQVLVPDNPEEYAALDAAEAKIDFVSTDPTSTRIESGLDVPVRVTDKEGRDDIRQVRYRRDAKAK